MFVKNQKQQATLLKDIQKHTNKAVSVRFVLANIHWYTLKEQLLMSSIIKKQKLDLIHFLHWNIPFFYSGNFIVTIHDLTMFHYARPEATTLGPIIYRVKDFAHRKLIKRIVSRAKKIIAPTQFVAEDIEKTFGNALNKTVVTHLAPYTSEQKNIDAKKILNNYSLKKNHYLLYVGSAYPHKNLSAVIKAWRFLLQWDPESIADYELVFVGKSTVFYEKVMRLAEGITSIRHLGFVPDSELEPIYRGASVFVFPSLSEGFGIPPLEAMAKNIPVVSSLCSCIPEVLQDAAIYTRVDDTENFAQTLQQAITDDSLRQQAKERGREVVKQYSWERAAQHTAALYK